MRASARVAVLMPRFLYGAEVPLNQPRDPAQFPLGKIGVACKFHLFKPELGCTKACQRLVYPLPNGGLRCRCKQAADCAFYDAPKGTSGLPHDYGVWFAGELGLQSCNLDYRPLLLAGIEVQFIEVLC